MKKIGILLLILGSLWSCKSDNSANDKIYTGELLEFRLPEDWTIGKEQPFDDMGSMMVTVEKEGENSSGQISVSMLQTAVAPPAYLDILKNQMLESMPNSAMVFSDPEKGDFNGIDCMQTNFTFAVEGLDYEGSLYAFFCQDNKSVVVYMNGAAPDLAENKAGFEKIKNSLTCVEKKVEQPTETK